MKRNETVLLVWIILTSIGIVGAILLILALIFISFNTWEGMTVEDVFPETDDMRFYVCFITVSLIGVTVYTILTVIVGKSNI